MPRYNWRVSTLFQLKLSQTSLYFHTNAGETRDSRASDSIRGLNQCVGFRVVLSDLPTSRVKPLTQARALASSSARVLGGAFVSSELRRFLETAATSSTAARKEASLAFDGLLKPLIFLTNCSAAPRISSSVTGGSKLNRVLMFLHTSITSMHQRPPLNYAAPSITPEIPVM
jgi:hypothetical protein